MVEAALPDNKNLDPQAAIAEQEDAFCAVLRWSGRRQSGRRPKHRSSRSGTPPTVSEEVLRAVPPTTEYSAGCTPTPHSFKFAKGHLNVVLDRLVAVQHRTAGTTEEPRVRVYVWRVGDEFCVLTATLTMSIFRFAFDNGCQ